MLTKIVEDKRLYTWVIALYVIIACAILLNADYEIALVTSWSNIYDVTDFSSFSDLTTFLSELRVPISPLWASVEISSQLMGLDPYQVVQIIYKMALFTTLLMVLLLVPRNRLIGSFIVSIIFLYGITLVHPFNPQYYDILLPAFVVGFIICLKMTRTNKYFYFWCLLAGCLICLADFTRPFIVYLFPVFVIIAYVFLDNKRGFIIFLLPIIIFSGIWHIHLYSSFGQISSSNHAGFNIFRAWAELVPEVELEPESDEPLQPDRWENLNNPVHYENSQKLQSAVVHYIVENPTESFQHLMLRFVSFYSVQSRIYINDVENNFIGIYRLTGIFCVLWLFVHVIRLSLGIFRHKLRLLSSIDNIVIILTFIIGFVLAVGESGEEARLIITILPLLACLPVARKTHKELSNKNLEIVSPELIT